MNEIDERNDISCVGGGDGVAVTEASKQMDPVGPNGEAILEYSVFDAVRAGFGKVVFA